MKRRMVLIAVITAIVLSTAVRLHADDEFNTAVHRLSDRIGHRPIRIPFLGAMLFFTPARGAHLKLATFENVHVALSLADLEASLNGSLAAEWHPFVRVDSRRSHESTLIYARVMGGDMRLMIINAEQGEVTVVEMDVPQKLQGSWLDHPAHEAHYKNHKDTDGDGDGA